MKKWSFIFIIFFLIILIITLVAYISNNKISVRQNDKQNQILNNIENSNIVDVNDIEENITYEEISSFSTDLFGDENRLENIRLSCNTINGTTLKNGDSFSFNDIIGEPTLDKGYKEADVIIGTKLTKGIGGGNCQVSTTLYNAILNIDGIEVTERHPHKRKVAYVEEGKDASVSFGTLDLKFTNNTGNTITIYMDSENQKVTARIVKS